jgi:hypothetical protein
MGVDIGVNRPETHGLRVDQGTMERGKDNLNKRPEYRSI